MLVLRLRQRAPVGARHTSGAWGICWSPSCPRPRAPGLYEARAFAGRASKTKEAGGKQEAKAEEAPVAESTASPPKEAGSGSSGQSVPKALLVLPLFRKPAFPSFKQVLQVREPEVVEILKTLRNKGQGEYISGFLAKEHAGMEASTTGTDNASVLRRDAGRVASASLLEDVGTVLQVLELTSFGTNQGGQITVMPRYRVRRVGTLSQHGPKALGSFGGFDCTKPTLQSKSILSTLSMHDGCCREHMASVETVAV
ncbi:unnamed protein product [Symbiodinium natans]|uniref:Lon N-terminal domain-containing protein n=1 Tax=Symbiodinium natans TaxID=878477 RepID=A0A812HUR5_9DINO|nr:unnamed protein product [Symbiodinium natans]